LRAAVRAIRRISHTAAVLTGPNGETVALKGSYTDPDAQVHYKGGGAQSRREIPQRTLLIVETDCPGIDKTWTVQIGEKVFFPARSPRDGSGGILLHLAPHKPETPAESGGGNGSTWR
jgi:hypothetical protein